MPVEPELIPNLMPLHVCIASDNNSSRFDLLNRSIRQLSCFLASSNDIILFSDMFICV